MSLRLVVLGTADAICSADRDNTYLALDSCAGILLIDCAGSPAHKLTRVGLDPGRVEGVLVTHAHPDHTYGLPVLIQHLVELGHERTLTLYGLVESLEVVRRLLRVFNMSPNFLVFHPLVAAEEQCVVANHEYRLLVSPVRHSIPTLGVRVEPQGDGVSTAYSSDTEPCEALVRLATRADLLIHECAVHEPTQGHSTPEQVGQIAAQCQVGRLVLIHCPAWMYSHHTQIVARVRQHYPRQVRMAADGEVYVISGA